MEVSPPKAETESEPLLGDAGELSCNYSGEQVLIVVTLGRLLHISSQGEKRRSALWLIEKRSYYQGVTKSERLKMEQNKICCCNT